MTGATSDAGAQSATDRIDKGTPVIGEPGGSLLDSDAWLPAAVIRQSVLRRNSR